MPRYINDIIVHCTATRAGREVSRAEVDAWHRARGFRIIGYHYLIHLDGAVERGRPISQAGAHCLGHNAHSVGICYVGGLGTDGQPCDTRTKAQKAALLKLVCKLVKMYRCDVHGHRDYAAKACPCFDAHAEYSGIYKRMIEDVQK